MRDALLVLGGLATLVAIQSAPGPSLGGDAYAYWAVDPANPYAGWQTQLGAFRYSPAAAQLSAPFGLIPFTWFYIGLVVVSAAVAWRTARVWVLLPFVILDLWFGNINVLLGAAVLAGFRYPAAWAFILLTKVTPGVGLLWFAVRREWRNLFIALGATGAIAAVSFALAPHLWVDWLRQLTAAGAMSSTEFPLPTPFRLPLAVALIAWGARTDRRWTVIVGAWLAVPVVWSATSPAMLLALAGALRPPNVAVEGRSDLEHARQTRSAFARGLAPLRRVQLARGG